VVKQVVRFCDTPHGRVAYAVTGGGPPLVYSLGWVSHIDLQWEMPPHRRFVELLSQRYTVIRYDKVGCGLSDRTREVFTLDSELEVLQALIDHLRIRRCALLGSCEGGQVAAALAARRPELVSSLLVYGSCADGRDLASEAVRESVLSLVRAHWGFASRMLADVWFPDAPAETVALFARFQRGAATAEMAAALLDLFYRIDVRALLPEVRVPTLVLHRRGSRAVRYELGRELASLIPGARLVPLEGRMQPVYWEAGDVAASAILSFLDGQAGGPGRGAAQPLTDRELQVVALIAEGLTNAEVGGRLGVSVRTVDAHLEHVRNKLGLRSRAQIAVWASEQRSAEAPATAAGR
jgi:pimeloyl-ACP methyl ester carboxylesterase/DNA-binding CsgD family transcriptional regulator